jgi:hypothetical protein
MLQVVIFYGRIKIFGGPRAIRYTPPPMHTSSAHAIGVRGAAAIPGRLFNKIYLLSWPLLSNCNLEIQFPIMIEKN